MRNNDIVFWYSIDGEFKPKDLVLAKNDENEMLVGLLNYVDGGYDFVGYTECNSGEERIKFITHFIPISELLLNVKEEK